MCSGHVLPVGSLYRLILRETEPTLSQYGEIPDVHKDSVINACHAEPYNIRCATQNIRHHFPLGTVANQTGLADWMSVDIGSVNAPRKNTALRRTMKKEVQKLNEVHGAFRRSICNRRAARAQGNGVGLPGHLLKPK